MGFLKILETRCGAILELDYADLQMLSLATLGYFIMFDLNKDKVYK